MDELLTDELMMDELICYSPWADAHCMAFDGTASYRCVHLLGPESPERLRESVIQSPC